MIVEEALDYQRCLRRLAQILKVKSPTYKDICEWFAKQNRSNRRRIQEVMTESLSLFPQHQNTLQLLKMRAMERRKPTIKFPAAEVTVKSSSTAPQANGVDICDYCFLVVPAKSQNSNRDIDPLTGKPMHYGCPEKHPGAVARIKAALNKSREQEVRPTA